jgi:LysM repeat protein
MKETLVENAFAACLDDIEQRGVSLDECLARYPELRDELEPALMTVLDVRAVPEWQVSPEFKATARQRIIRRIRQQRSEPSLLDRLSVLNPFAWVGRMTAAPAAVRMMIVMVAALLVVTGGTAIASSETQPDNPLYQVKIAAENLELLLKPAGDGRTTLLTELLDRRASELLTMSWQSKADSAERALVNYQAALEVGHQMLDSYDPANVDAAAFAVQWQEALARTRAVMQGLVDGMPAASQPGLRAAIQGSQREQAWVNDLLQKTPQRSSSDGSPAHSPDASPTPGRCSYTVKKGDTLSAIAQRYNTTWSRLSALNNLASPDSINPGQQLSVPCTPVNGDGQLTPPAEFKICPYTVKAGDTLSSIAQKYSTTTRLLIAVNNLASADRILAGQPLSVPCYVK